MSTVTNEKIGEDEAYPGAYRFRLANDVPIRRGLAEVADESLFKLTVEMAEAVSRADRAEAESELARSLLSRLEHRTSPASARARTRKGS